MFRLNRTYQASVIKKNELLNSNKFFVTYANPNYFDILYYLIKGLNIYSEIPIIIYIVNIKNNNILLPEKFKEFKNVILRYVYSNEHIWATKFTIMIDSINFINNKNTDFIFLDADTIVNYSIDELFNYSNKVTNMFITIYIT